MTESNAPDYEVGFKKPPRSTQFAKGQSGNPRGRPKRPEFVSLRALFSREQRGKNGAVITRREALVIKLLNDAMNGKQRAFARFLKLMTNAGLFAKEESPRGGCVFFFPADPALPAYTMIDGKKEIWRR